MAKATKKNTYRVIGTGDTPRSANRSLGSSKGSLAKKLAGANVSTEVGVERTHYTGTFDLKGGGASRTLTVASHFVIESDSGWEAVQRKATDTGKVLDMYDAVYRVDQTLRLTAAQAEALEPRHTPAGGEYCPSDGLLRELSDLR